MIFDPLYFIILAPALILGFWAQARVKSAYHEGDEVPAGMTGAAAARMILDRYGLRDVGVELTQGFLSDHYDPSDKVLRLSPSVYHGRTASAVGIAAHEAGHALQDAERYTPLVLRNAAVPVANFGSMFGFIIVIVGGFLVAAAATTLGVMAIYAGIALYSATVVFQLVNLPVEYDASARAKMQLAELGIVTPVQGQAVEKVLNAAALTYVAATLSAVLTLLYLVLRFGGMGNSSE